MKSAEYWRKRAEQVAADQHVRADDYIDQLSREYERAAQSIQRDLEAFYARFAANNKVSMADARKMLTSGEMQEFKITLEEFRVQTNDNADDRWTKELDNAYMRTRVSRFDALLIQIRHQVEMLTANHHGATSALLTGIYDETYHRTIYEIQKGIGVGVSFARIDSEAVEKVLLTPWHGSNYSERVWGNRDKLVNELRTNLAQSFIRGDSVARASRDLAGRMGVSYSSAARLVRTEGSHIANEASWDGYVGSGVVKKYEILSTLDGRTSHVCRGMDGHVFALNEKEVGVNFPPFHGNCRTTTVPYFDDEEDVGERIARDADGKTYYVPGNMTYGQWRDKYAG